MNLLEKGAIEIVFSAQSESGFYSCYFLVPPKMAACDLQFWLKQTVPSMAWCHERHRVTITWACVSALARWRDPFWLKQGVILDMVHRRKVVTDRGFQQGLRGQTDLRSLVRRGVGPTHQLPRNASRVSGPSILPTGYTGTPCASTLRQQVHGVIHKQCLEATLHAGERPFCVGSEQSALTEGDACAGKNEPRSRHVVEEQCLFRGKGCSTRPWFRKFGKPLAELE